MNNQDWYINQLGITQYVLRDRYAIKGDALINIADNIRLIVITQSTTDTKIFYDILKAIHVTTDDCLILSPAQLAIPIERFDRVIWLIDETLPESWLHSPELKNKAVIESVSLSQLAKEPNLKRQLWNSLCQYENYFRPN